MCVCVWNFIGYNNAVKCTVYGNAQQVSKGEIYLKSRPKCHFPATHLDFLYICPNTSQYTFQEGPPHAMTYSMKTADRVKTQASTF